MTLFFASLLGSALNSVAGGGSFFTFPTLIFAGVPILNANATSTMALLPGSISNAYLYRHSKGGYYANLIPLISVSVAGSIFGTILLIYTPPHALKTVLPYLLLFATLLLIFKNRIAQSRWSQIIGENKSYALAFQFFIAIYGGYFGGGIGILMLATFNLMGFKDLVQMNGLKAWLGSSINVVALIIFIAKDLIVWRYALTMVAGSLLGGYLGFLFGTKVPTKILHGFIVTVGLALTVYFFLKS